MAFLFPKNFLWGAATSAHQVEGNTHNDWTEWEKLGLVKNGERSGLSTNHYHRFKEDFALAKDLGHTAHRLSIEWSRIEPKPGVIDRDALDHYRQVLQELHHLKIEPIVTLHHFTNPVWVARAGGWTNRATVDRFGRYVDVVMQELGSLSNYWITINEPTVITSLGYVTGYWPPQKKSYFKAWTAIRHLVRAHDLAYHIIHRRYSSAKVGSANNVSDFVPYNRTSPIDQLLKTFAHFWHNQWWLDQTFDTQDFIGVNYYFHHPLRFRWAWPLQWFEPFHVGDKPVSDVGWAIVPSGLGRLLEWLRNYQRPIIITENGIADHRDAQRSDFIRHHLAYVAHAISQGIDVRGYIHWSLMDNFEWREGFDPRFGLIDVDYHTQQRTVRPSAYTLRDIIRNGLPSRKNT